jgi:hypothetical protein
MQYHPDRRDIFRRWRGTVLQKTFRSSLLLALVNLLMLLNADHVFRVLPALRAELDMVDKLWRFQTTITTFVLAFFLNQA